MKKGRSRTGPLPSSAPMTLMWRTSLIVGIDNHLQFSEDEAGSKAMFARENRARERYNKCRAMDCVMEAGSYFEEK